ncbi:hypothetical protein [Paenibacillus polymyxa]|uniref:hypothetical protein n=1 Tax=Paenibacillus polymyxa TaxID=1406 RepID=UPI000F4F9FED|nr:hypothetical protein [Paenibacillus polymyxa]RPE10557.1 hypothetical protein EG487_02490 [Paenibacillus polymyxa]
MHKREVSNFMVIDYDRKMFNVIESENGHEWWKEKVSEQVAKGRKLIGYPSAKGAVVLKKEYQDQFGYTYTKDSVLLPFR